VIRFHFYDKGVHD